MRHRNKISGRKSAPGASRRHAAKPAYRHPADIDQATWEWLEAATPAQREHYATTGERRTVAELAMPEETSHE